MTEEDSENLKTLAQVAKELAERVDELNRDKGSAVLALAEYAKMNRRLIWATAVAALMAVLLTLGILFAVVGVMRNNQRIDTVTQRLDVAQTVQRAKVLCPLYEIYLSTEGSPPPNQTPEESAARAHAFMVIHQGYDALNCKDLK